MALSLYDPDKQAYRNWTPAGAMSTTDMLLLNILIEQKLIAHFLQIIAGSDEIANIRPDIVNAP
jgi:hypothetical protein